MDLHPPACCLHCLLVPVRIGREEGALLIVLLVDVASVELAIHALAFQAAEVLLGLHAASDILLGALAAGDDASLVPLSACIAVLISALLVLVCLSLVTSCTWILLEGGGSGDEKSEDLHCSLVDSTVQLKTEQVPLEMNQ